LLLKPLSFLPGLAAAGQVRSGDPLMNKLAACGTSLWFSATVVVGSAAPSRAIRAWLDSSDVTSEVAKAAKVVALMVLDFRVGRVINLT
jgi:hypothetical protein